MSDPYQNSYHHSDADGYGTYGEGDQDGYGYQTDYPPQEEDAASDVTEGHDEDDQMYEGEYQGIPHPDEVKAARRAARARARGPTAADAVSELQELAEQYEDILEDCGHGRFQWSLFVVLGLALMADSVECFVVALALPSAEKDMCLSKAEKGMLGLIVFLGMMFGAFVWGGLADQLGRRKCLIIALAINCIAGFLSSFAQAYGFFIFFRLISGIGIGGSVPIVYSYFSEFLRMDKRGEHLSWLCMFWMMGGIYASFTAWGIIPHYGWGFSMGTQLQFQSWRVFVLVCVLPAIAALVGLTFMPESPRFLLERAKHDEAWMILKQVHDTNWRAKGEPERVFTVSQIKTPKTQDDEFFEIQSSTGTAFQRWVVRSLTLVKLVLKNVASLLARDLRLATLLMAGIWFTVAFSYYGLVVWFPDMIKHLQHEEYDSKMKVFYRERVERFHFNFSLENQIHKEGEYINDKFINLEMKSVKFENSLFEDCYFEDIKSTNTFFENCTIRSTVFYNTDLYKEKFVDCKMENTFFNHTKKGCHLNFEEQNDVLIYLVSFLGSLAVLPGNIISALFMDKIGRVKMIGGSMLLSAGCTFFLFISFSQATIIIWQCLFCGVSVAAWNGIEVITVELYPTSKRATAFGLLNAVCKLAAILGSFIFASFVGVTKVVPILLSCVALLCGGLLALKLPETREKALL
ncbi:synaptic vesicle glycoprotein 2B [Electrophorus electricus]|uniref:Major facilitator superfamily (MFS) profile domain-containing protein n=1 Tax=Electrophorus electricus TaxID=8005 RepID=A0A4W4GM09_ELEEL|nr:synaptic vesicle glycoprotein 2B [Electrophorus electricus]XP_035388337.1 synaptic vesicle glycoprotein 2B [Electrophorus electricus]XP_035388338.1 synaptic vesicle glycoprotein 2B [Electrophorus electricus]